MTGHNSQLKPTKQDFAKTFFNLPSSCIVTLTIKVSLKILRQCYYPHMNFTKKVFMKIPFNPLSSCLHFNISSLSITLTLKVRRYCTNVTILHSKSP